MSKSGILYVILPWLFEKNDWKMTAIYYVVIIRAKSSASNEATLTQCLFSPADL